MAKIAIPSIFGSPTSKKRSKPLQRRSDDALSVASRPTSAPLSPRSKSVRTPPSARLRAQLQHLRPQSTLSRSDSNASSPGVEHSESWKKEAKSAKGEDALGDFGADKTIDVKERDVKDGRHTPGSPCPGEEKAESNGKSVEAKARHMRDGRPVPSSPVHDSDETPELLLVLQEVRRKREATERKQWLEKWEGFADSLGSNLDLDHGAGEKISGEEKKKKKEIGKAKSSNWLLERPMATTRFPSDEKSELSERQKAMNRLPIEEEEDSPLRRGKSSISLPLPRHASPSQRKRPVAKAATGEPRGWETLAEEEQIAHGGKRSYTPAERQAALSRLPLDERKKLSGSFEHVVQQSGIDSKADGTEAKTKGNAVKAKEKGGKVTPPPIEGDPPSTVYFSPRTLRTYVTLSPATKNDFFALSPAPKRSTRAAPSHGSRMQPTPGPRSSSRSFSEAPSATTTTTTTTPSPHLKKTAAQPASTLRASDRRSIPRLALPAHMAGDVEAQRAVARWQVIREALWYDAEEEEEGGSYAERMRLCAAGSLVAASGTAVTGF